MDSSSHNGRRLIQIYCTLCGNRALLNVRTGEAEEGAMWATHEMIADIRRGTCIYCGALMEVHDLTASERMDFDDTGAP